MLPGQSSTYSLSIDTSQSYSSRQMLVDFYNFCFVSKINVDRLETFQIICFPVLLTCLFFSCVFFENKRQIENFYHFSSAIGNPVKFGFKKTFCIFAPIFHLKTRKTKRRPFQKKNKNIKEKSLPKNKVNKTKRILINLQNWRSFSQKLFSCDAW